MTRRLPTRRRTPLEADITEASTRTEVRITAAVNNILHWQSIPPGRVEQTADGPRQRYFHDFYNYAGLHRPVWLSTRPETHINDITVVTGLEGSTGTVRYAVETDGVEGTDIRVVLRDAEGTEVASADGALRRPHVNGVHPWGPAMATLEMTAELRRNDGSLVDEYHCRWNPQLRVDGAPLSD